MVISGHVIQTSLLFRSLFGSLFGSLVNKAIQAPQPDYAYSNEVVRVFAGHLQPTKLHFVQYTAHLPSLVLRHWHDYVHEYPKVEAILQSCSFINRQSHVY